MVMIDQAVQNTIPLAIGGTCCQPVAITACDNLGIYGRSIDDFFASNSFYPSYMQNSHASMLEQLQWMVAAKQQTLKR
jgi:hypothetical protein